VEFGSLFVSHSLFVSLPCRFVIDYTLLAMPLRLRARLGPYEVVGLLGAGGMGEVYHARDTRLGRDVAIKVLPEQAAGDPSRRRRFEHEARAASALNHPNICTIHDIVEHDGAPFIVMELLDGMSLREYLRAAPPKLPVLLDLAMQIADALEAAHAAGIIHRDLTPSNIFVTARGDAKILDFGLAKLTPGQEAEGNSDASTVTADIPLTAPGHTMGTPGYASPEQTLGLPVDARTDLFSFGVILYEMATGRRAFSGESPALAGDAVVHAAPTPVSRLNPLVPPGLADIIDKAIEKDPALRYQSAAEIRADLRRLKRNAEGAAATPFPVPTAQAPDPRTPSGGEGRRPFGPDGRALPPPSRPVWKQRAFWGVLALVVLCAAGTSYVLWNRAAMSRTALPEMMSHEVTSGPFVDVEPAVSPDGNTIAFVVDDGTHQSIWMVEARGGLGTPWTKSSGRHRHPAWAPDGRIFFESDAGGRRGIYTAPSFDSEKSILVVPNGREPAVSWDGTRLAFVTQSESGYQRISVTEVDNWSAVRQLTRDGDGRWDHVGPAWSPDQRQICYYTANGLWTIVADGSSRPVQVSRGTIDSHPAWSKSGHIYFSSTRDGLWQLWRIAPGGSVAQRVTGGTGIEQMPSVSRDGRVLVYSTAYDQPDVYVREQSTGVERPIGGGGDKSFPSFSPDARALYVMLSAWNRKSLWVQSLSDGAPSGPMRPLMAQAGPQAQAAVYSQPAASPDGRWVAFLCIQGDSRDIFVVPAAGGTPVNITNHPAADFHPAWSPDSLRLAFVSERDGEQHVWLQDVVNGRPSGGATRLTRGAAFENAPAWSPNGRRIAFITGTTESSEVAVSEVGGDAPAAVVTAGAHAQRVRWSPTRGWLLICGKWSSERVSIRAFDPLRGVYIASIPAVDLGPDPPGFVFDVSSDERYLALVRVRRSGRIGVLEATSGTF
jgi:Tol biopolymer transport system component/predicted Ser/Thr protein kinase